MYALMWSGGKDSALVLHRARAAGLDVTRLISFFDSATGRVRFHGVRVELLEEQARAAGVPIRTIGTSWPEMEGRLADELATLKREGFTGVVLGDIHLADVRAWYETRVIAAGLEHVEPIWGEPPGRLLREFVDAGGRAVVTCVDLTRLDRSWLGRVIDESFANEIAATGIDPCGENGEYHSYVFAGPMLRRPIGWRLGEIRDDGRFAQVDVIGDADPNGTFRSARSTSIRARRSRTSRARPVSRTTTWCITRSSATRAPAPRRCCRSTRTRCAASSRPGRPRTGRPSRASSTGWKPV